MRQEKGINTQPFEHYSQNQRRCGLPADRYIYIYIYGRPPPPPRSTPKDCHNRLTPYIYSLLYMQMHKTLQISRVFLLRRLFQTSLLHRCAHADARNGLPGSGGWFLVLPTSFLWRCVCVCVSAKCEYGLPETQEIGTVQHFRLSRRQKCCTEVLYCPYFWLAWGPENRDITALSLVQTAEVLYSPYFWLAGTNKVLYCP